MKIKRHNVFVVFLVGVTTVFSQVQTQKTEELFKVNDDVVVEINSHDTAIQVEYWNEKSVAVKTVLEVENVSKKEAEELFKSWKVEALGNSSKIVVQSNLAFHEGNAEMVDLHIETPVIPAEIQEIEIDFEPVVAYALKFDSVSFPSPPQMPKAMLAQLGQVEWDQAAYEKDKEKYMETFKLKQEQWAKEMEIKLAPQMAAYEKEMEQWKKEFEKKYQPQMEAYQQEMEKWQANFEKNIAPKLAEHQKEMSTWQRKFEVEMAPKIRMQQERMIEFQKEVEAQQKNSLRLKKKIHIKLPKSARVKLNIHDGSIQLPEGIKKI